MIKLFIVDDHTLLRKLLIEDLNEQKNMKIIAEAKDSKECLSIYKKIKPDIILMDISLPDKSGLITAQEILEKNPKQKIIILSMFEDEQHIFEAFQIGASGYFIKNKTFEELVKIIEVVYDEGLSVPRGLTQKLINGLRTNIQPQKRFKLTKAEIKILQLLKKGLSNKEIMRCTSMSESTIKNYLVGIYYKLAVDNRTQAIVKTIEANII